MTERLFEDIDATERIKYINDDDFTPIQAAPVMPVSPLKNTNEKTDQKDEIRP
jgi:hypothetical protein